MKEVQGGDGERGHASSDLADIVRRATKYRRPILHHLNADTSWLLQLPVPSEAGGRASDTNSGGGGGRIEWYNILLDPWLAGSQSDVASWFSKQYHAQRPARGSIAAVRELIREVEALCGAYAAQQQQSETTTEPKPETETKPERKTETETERKIETETATGGTIHAVAISHEFTDHCHRATLLQLDPAVRVLAAPKAAALVRSWKHFDIVHDLPVFQADWRAELGGVGGVPGWVGVGRVQTSGDAFYYHSAVMVVWAAPHPSSAKASECIIYTPHGIRSPALASLRTARPPLQPLCFLHGLHDVSIDWGQQLNLGAHNGLAAQAVLRAKYWVGTHDEVKRGGGVVSWFLRRKTYSVQDVLQSLPGAEGAYAEVGNGEAIVLL